MASLKEVKNRIASVSSTKKITQARQMVSSAQLHRAQDMLENAVKYKEALDNMLSDLSANSDFDDSPLTQQQNTGPVAVVMMSSNSGMCGSFNANMIKILHSIEVYYPGEELLFFPIGKKIREAIEQCGYNIDSEKGSNLDLLASKTTYKDVAGLVSYLINLYCSKKIKQVDFIYYEYKSMAIQEIKEVTFLPYSIPPATDSKEKEDYIFEPSREELIKDLIPMVLRSNMYYTLMENQTSEHAARTMAMQLATENADEILVNLHLSYNKLRQQNITSELLDIIGGSFA